MLVAALLVASFARPRREGRAGSPTRGIVEPSGLVASRRHPGIFWTHNDSGNPPALFAVRRDGSLVREYKVAAANVDWEDIGIDDAGHLYLGDIGDNLHVLPVHAILRIDEPDPAEASERPLAATAFHFRYPEGKRFDAEGLFVDGDRAVVVSKSGDGREAELFAVPLDAAAPILETGDGEAGRRAAEMRASRDRGARLSADGECWPSARSASFGSIVATPTAGSSTRRS